MRWRFRARVDAERAREAEEVLEDGITQLEQAATRLRSFDAEREETVIRPLKDLERLADGEDDAEPQ